MTRDAGETTGETTGAKAAAASDPLGFRPGTT